MQCSAKSRRSLRCRRRRRRCFCAPSDRRCSRVCFSPSRKGPEEEEGGGREWRRVARRPLLLWPQTRHLLVAPLSTVHSHTLTLRAAGCCLCHRHHSCCCCCWRWQRRASCCAVCARGQWGRHLANGPRRSCRSICQLACDVHCGGVLRGCDARGRSFRTVATGIRATEGARQGWLRKRRPLPT